MEEFLKRVEIVFYKEHNLQIDAAKTIHGLYFLNCVTLDEVELLVKAFECQGEKDEDGYRYSPARAFHYRYQDENRTLWLDVRDIKFITY